MSSDANGLVKSQMTTKVIVWSYGEAFKFLYFDSLSKKVFVYKKSPKHDGMYKLKLLSSGISELWVSAEA